MTKLNAKILYIIGRHSAKDLVGHAEPPGTTEQSIVDNCGLSANFSSFQNNEAVNTGVAGL